MDVFMAMGQQFQTYRESKGYTRQELAVMCCTTSHFLYLMETGQKWPKYHLFNDMCRVLSTTPQQFFEGWCWTYTEPDQPGVDGAA